MPEVILSGPEGRIEGRYHQSPIDGAPIAIVLHPHPLYGGTMNNKIVYRLFQAFVKNNFSVLRFNFRGVGKSLGTYDEGIGELADAATALDWIQQKNLNATSCWIGGFSFGSWIAMQLLMRRPEIEGFISVSPPAGKYDFSFLSPCPSAGLITQGNIDDIVKISEVDKLVDKLQNQKNADIDYETFEGADHYYRNSLEELESIMTEYIADQLRKKTESMDFLQDRKRRK